MYKRQPVKIINPRDSFGPKIPLHRIRAQMRSQGAVSYTHLDVYKRQPVFKRVPAYLNIGMEPNNKLENSAIANVNRRTGISMPIS